MKLFGDGRKDGFIPAQDHREEGDGGWKNVATRISMFCVRLIQKRKAPIGEVVVDKDLAGDFHGIAVWEQAEGKRDIPMWRTIWGARRVRGESQGPISGDNGTIDTDTRTPANPITPSAGDPPQATETSEAMVPLPVKGSVGAGPPTICLPMKGGTWAEDKRFKEKKWIPRDGSATFSVSDEDGVQPPGWPAFPNGFTFLITATNDEREQILTLHPTDPRLVAAHRGDGAFGTVVCDLLGREVDESRYARLQTIMRVVKKPAGMVGLVGNTSNTLALCLSRTGQGDEFGGLWCDGKSETKLTLGLPSVRNGGPIDCVDEGCVHKAGADADGNVITPVHLSSLSVFRTSKRVGKAADSRGFTSSGVQAKRYEGPLHFEIDWPKPPDMLYPTLVRMGYDDQEKYALPRDSSNLGMFQGKFKWWTTVAIGTNGGNPTTNTPGGGDTPGGGGDPGGNPTTGGGGGGGDVTTPGSGSGDEPGGGEGGPGADDPGGPTTGGGDHWPAGGYDYGPNHEPGGGGGGGGGGDPNTPGSGTGDEPGGGEGGPGAGGGGNPTTPGGGGNDVPGGGPGGPGYDPDPPEGRGGSPPGGPDTGDEPGSGTGDNPPPPPPPPPPGTGGGWDWYIHGGGGGPPPGGPAPGAGGGGGTDSGPKSVGLGGAGGANWMGERGNKNRLKKPRVQANSGSVMLAREHAVTTLELALPGIVARPQRIQTGLPDLRYSVRASLAVIRNAELNQPHTGRIEAYGKQTDLGYAYTQLPKNSRSLSGTAPGGFVVLPPEVDVSELLNTSYPLGIDDPNRMRSTTYFALPEGAKLAFGVPDLATGKVVSGVVMEHDLSALTMTVKTVDASGAETTLFTVAAGKITMAPAANIEMGEGGNIVTGTATGSKFGASGPQKISFHGAAPSVQDTGWSVTNPSTSRTINVGVSSLADTQATLGTLMQKLIDKGVLGA